MRLKENVRAGRSYDALNCSHYLGLALTARTEAEMVRRSQRRPDTALPSSESSTQLALALESSIAEEQLEQEDVYQAQTCLGWIHWNNGSWELAKSSLPTRLLDIANGSQEHLSNWTYVSIVKAAFIRGKLT